MNTFTEIFRLWSQDLISNQQDASRKLAEIVRRQHHVEEAKLIVRTLKERFKDVTSVPVMELVVGNKKEGEVLSESERVALDAFSHCIESYWEVLRNRAYVYFDNATRSSGNPHFIDRFKKHIKLNNIWTNEVFQTYVKDKTTYELRVLDKVVKLLDSRVDSISLGSKEMTKEEMDLVQNMTSRTELDRLFHEIHEVMIHNIALKSRELSTHTQALDLKMKVTSITRYTIARMERFILQLRATKEFNCDSDYSMRAKSYTTLITSYREQIQTQTKEQIKKWLEEEEKKCEEVIRAKAFSIELMNIRTSFRKVHDDHFSDLYERQDQASFQSYYESTVKDVDDITAALQAKPTFHSKVSQKLETIKLTALKGLKMTKEKGDSLAKTPKKEEFEKKYKALLSLAWKDDSAAFIQNLARDLVDALNRQPKSVSESIMSSMMSFSGNESWKTDLANVLDSYERSITTLPEGVYFCELHRYVKGLHTDLQKERESFVKNVCNTFETHKKAFEVIWHIIEALTDSDVYHSTPLKYFPVVKKNAATLVYLTVGKYRLSCFPGLHYCTLSQFVTKVYEHHTQQIARGEQ